MNMTEEEKKAIITFRFEKALSTLTEAEKSVTFEMYSSAANRLYYAFYYAASAALLSRDITTHTHSGLQSMIHLHFVKEGILTTEDGILMRKLFTLRQESDYDDFMVATREDVLPLIEPTKKIILKLKSITGSN